MHPNKTENQMAKTKDIVELDASTEEKIKSAARTVFLKKGYAATRTREIADEANINLALLNYYFRSKEKLFEMILHETLIGFIEDITSIMNDENTSLEKKIEMFTSNYIDFITREPGLPIFLLSELRDNSSAFFDKITVKNILLDTAFHRQYDEAYLKGKITEANPFHFLLNLMSLIIFPFIGKSILQKFGEMTETQFKTMIEERKRMIPLWIKAMYY